MKRLIIAIVALAAALLLQLTIVNGLPLPGSGVPDLVLLCVVAVGLVGGPQPGLIAGFCAGLALDLAPPANELIGQYALVFCLVGYGCGRLRFTLRQSAFLALLAAAGACAAGELLVAGLVLVLDTPQATLATVAQVLPSSVLYDIVLSPVVMFAAVRVALALGVNFSSLDDSPALETGGSARPMGLAGLALLRRRHASAGVEGIGGGWLTGDSAAETAPVGAVGWLTGPATSRRARRRQARLTAALTGAAPRKGAFWVGSRPPGLRPGAAATTAPAPGLPRLHPEAGVAGSATRTGQIGGLVVTGADRPGQERHGLNGPGLPSISFGGGKSAAAPAGGNGGRSLPGLGRLRGRGAQRIAFKTGQLAGIPEGGQGGAGPSTPKISFGTGGLPGAGRASGRGVPKIAFGTGLPRAPRTSPGRKALPKFRRAASSATGQWLAGERLRASGFTYVSSPSPARLSRRSRFGGGLRSRRPGRLRKVKTARMRRRRVTGWLRKIGRKAGGQR